MTGNVDLGWEDVLRRARRRPRKRFFVAAVVAAALLGGGPALGVLLTRDAPPQLPRGADRANVAVVLRPQTGRTLLEIAPWKAHDGFCYVVLQKRAGCIERSGQTVAFWPPPVVFTFDPRVTASNHGHVYRFPKLRVAVVLPPATVHTITLLDRHRRPVILVRVNR